MKKQKFIWSVVLGSAMFLSSCSNDDSVIDVDKPVNANATVTVSLITPGTRTSSGIEDPAGREGEINSFEVYTFSGNTLIDYVQKSSGNTASLKASQGPGNTIVVIANANPAIGDGHTLSELKALEGAFKFTKTTSLDIPLAGFMMSGIEENLNFTEGINSVTVTVKRLVSKFINPTCTPTVEIPDAELALFFDDAGATAQKTTFTYEARALANGVEQSYIFKQDTWTRPFTYLNSEFEGDGSYKPNAVYSGGFLDKLNDASIFVHENYPKADYTVDNVTGYNPKEVYCYIIKGTLKHGTTVSEPRYWRVNLVRTTTANTVTAPEHYAVQRNGLYKVTVNSLKTVGHKTPKEAEEETEVIPVIGDVAVNVTVDFAPWDVYESGTDM